MQDQLYTVDEVAERLKVHPETVRRWLRVGRLEGVKLSASGIGSYRVSESAVAKFLATLGDQPPE